MARTFSALILALILATTIVAADLNVTVVRHDTDVQSTYEQLKVCSCGGQVDTFRVKNIGQLEAHYGFTLESTKSWFTLERDGLWLPAGASADVHVFTQAPCDAVGTATYTVYVASEYGRYRAIEKTITTGVCQNIESELTPAAATIAPCDEQAFTLHLTNVGTFRETYRIDGLSLPASVTLDAGESTRLVGGYTASCSEWGTTTIPVTITGENNKLTQKETATITVPRAYDYAIDFGTVQRPVCVGVTTAVPVIVKNLEDRANTVTLTGEPWSTALDTFVEGKSVSVVDVPFTPTRAGEREFTITAEGRNGTIEKTARTLIPVEACYGFSLEAPSTVQACPGEVHIPFTIRSEGSQPQSLGFDVRSNATTAIDGLDATLNPGQELTKTVRVTVPDGDRTYYVTLDANSTYASESETVSLKGYSTESCYQVRPTEHKFRVWTDQTVLPVLIEHQGIQPATYELHYNGTFMRPVENQLTIGPDGRAVVHFVVNSTDYATGRYLDRLSLSTHGIDYTTDFEIKLTEKGFWERFLDACRYNGEFGVCSVTSTLSLLILLFVIIAVIGILTGFVRYERPIKMSRETAGFIGGAILVLLLIAMLVSAPTISRAYERPIGPSDPADLYFEIGQGQSVTLDLAPYFDDPDNDTLAYTASPSANLLVDVRDGVAVIKANRRFAGQETLVFTASDRRGGLADSDVITVSVVPFKPITFLEYWQLACWFLTSAFLFIAVGIALLAFVLLDDRKREQPRRSRAITLYRRPRTQVIKGEAQELVEKTDTGIRNIPSDTPFTHIQNQVNANQVVVNQGEKEQLWVTSQNGTRFHRITCPVVKAIPSEKRIIFKSREDAIKAGYNPCKTCSSH